MDEQLQFWAFNRLKDADLISEEQEQCHGSYVWQGFEVENILETIPDIAGIYILVSGLQDGYILLSAWIINSLKQRFKEHICE